MELKEKTYTIEIDRTTYSWLLAMADKYNCTVNDMAIESIREYLPDDVDNSIDKG